MRYVEHKGLWQHDEGHPAHEDLIALPGFVVSVASKLSGVPGDALGRDVVGFVGHLVHHLRHACTRMHVSIHEYMVTREEVSGYHISHMCVCLWVYLCVSVCIWGVNCNVFKSHVRTLAFTTHTRTYALICWTYLLCVFAHRFTYMQRQTNGEKRENI